VSLQFIPLHYGELRQQAVSAEAKPNEQVRVEAAFWELPHNSRSSTKLAIPVPPHYKNIIPPELEGRVEVGTRVKVPFGTRQVLGVVTALAGDSPHTNLRAIVKVIGALSLVTPKVLALARWIADYYCCPVKIALISFSE
jgi:primosomal protein N'